MTDNLIKEGDISINEQEKSKDEDNDYLIKPN